MAAWQSRPVHGTYENREDYHFHDATQQQAKAHAALSDIEHIFANESDYRAFSAAHTQHNGFSHDYKKGVETQALEVTGVLDVPPEGILYVKDDHQFMRKVIGYQAMTKTIITSESYRQRSQNLTEVTVETMINNETPLFRSHYTFEQYASNEIWATFSTNDVADLRQAEHDMTPYDYEELEKVLGVVKALRATLHKRDQEIEA